MVSIEENLRREQVADIARTLPQTAFVGLVCCLALTAIFWPDLPKWAWLFGTVPLTVQVIASIIINKTWFETLSTDADYSKAFGIIEVQAIINGVGWFVLLGGIFYSVAQGTDNTMFFAVVCAIVMGCSAGAINLMPSYLPAMLWFIVPANLAGATLMVTGRTFDQQAVGLLFLLFMLISVMLAIRRFKFFRDGVHIRYRNAALLEAYREQKEIAENSSRAKARFLAAASHDLRQPIHAIGLLVDTLESQAQSPDIKVLGNSISESVDDLTSLLDVILDISRIDAGLIQAQPTVFEVGRLLGGLHKRFDHIAIDKGLELRIRDTKVRAYCDPALLERILNNLVANAIKYTKSGGVLVGVRNRGPSAIRIDVWDTGIGIPDHAVKDVFLEYYQIGNLARAETEGLGLGLSIVRGLCTALGFDLRVRSQVDKGSVFSVTIPRGVSLSGVSEREDPVLMTEGDANVLLIDDDARVLGATSQLLVSLGYRVRVAESSTTALRLMEDGFAPDVVVCDYRLNEERNGSDVLTDIRRRYGTHIQGVLITADTDPQRLLDAKQSGYVLRHKPLSAVDLRETVARLAHEPTGDEIV